MDTIFVGFLGKHARICTLNEFELSQGCQLIIEHTGNSMYVSGKVVMDSRQMILERSLDLN